MSITPEQALAAAATLYPRIGALEEILFHQVQLLPPGNADWAKTLAELDLHRGALQALQNIAAACGGGQ